MKRKVLMLPVVSLGAEFLTMGYLMRRNILAYKAPPKNEGYDLICIHPNPRKARKQIRVQVKSRYQTDSNKAIFVTKRSLNAFDYLIAVFLNIGYFYRKTRKPGGRGQPEFYTLPNAFVRKHLVRASPAWIASSSASSMQQRTRTRRALNSSPAPYASPTQSGPKRAIRTRLRPL
jgi:hypothetical protein